MGEEKPDEVDGSEARAPLTPLELQLMQVVWRQGPGDVAAVQAGLAQELAYTTVQTMLNILVRKGKLRRTLRGRAYHYSAEVSEARAHSHALRDLVSRMFGGSSEQLVMRLLDDRQLDPEQIARLRLRLDAQLGAEQLIDERLGDERLGDEQFGAGRVERGQVSVEHGPMDEAGPGRVEGEEPR